MGGNAIKDARRIDKIEFFQICHELQDIFPELKMKPVKAYHQKNDFGDIDMVVETQQTLNIENLVRNRISPVDEYVNGPYYSFAYKGVQVDFIKTSPQYFISTLNYMHWNDLGNFFGRVARALNFKYGSDGLSYEKHIDGHYKITVNVTTDTTKALEFLGYDYEAWKTGFDTKEDIFKFVTISKYFNSKYFSLEDQSHVDRVRNRKRKMYQGFLEYVAQNNIEPKPKLTEEQRLVEYNRARKMFGDDFHNKVEHALSEYKKSLEAKKYFNGDLISEKTGLVGKALGFLMTELKKTWNEQNTYGNPKTKFANFNDYLLCEQDDAIDNLFYMFSNENFYVIDDYDMKIIIESTQHKPFYKFKTLALNHELYMINNEIYYITFYAGTSCIRKIYKYFTPKAK